MSKNIFSNDKQLNIDYHQELAQQLRCPEGKKGIYTAQNMELNNAGMIEETINKIPLKPGQKILEIGYANGKHINKIFKKQQEIIYHGIDISLTMFSEAKKHNQELIQSDKCCLHYTANGNLDFFNDSEFDHIFSVNTIYFWEQPLVYLQNLNRILKQDGYCIITFADKHFMQKLPFTAYNFRLYEKNEVQSLCRQSGFEITDIICIRETVNSNAEFEVERDYYIFSLIKI